MESLTFLPRPLSSLEILKQTKNSKLFLNLFETQKEHYSNPFEVKYYDEFTINLYSKSFLLYNLIPELNKIENFIWIDSNHILKSWNGNYSKGRPDNIDSIVSEYDKVMESALKNIITLKGWSENEIKQFTIDNIHFNHRGFLELNKRIEEKIAQILFNYQSEKVNT